MPVENGNKVKVDYELLPDDGTLFDSSQKKGGPIEFVIGAENTITGFENAIIGIEKGDEKEIKLLPQEAYGDYKPDLVETLPRDQFPDEIKAGLMVLMELPNGARMRARILEVTDESVTIDLDHELTGKTLHFKINLVDFEES